MTTTVDGRLKALGLTLPDAPAPVANYVPFHIAGNLLFISGQISRAGDGSVTTGKLGAAVDVAGGRAAAKLCALNILSQAKAALGSLDRVGANREADGLCQCRAGIHRASAGGQRRVRLPRRGSGRQGPPHPICRRRRQPAT